MPETSKMDRNLALEAVRVTEAAALSASRLMGRGDEKAAEQPVDRRHRRHRRG
jgi:fructose-1,6-bisphosphatase II / sedoheptulose-1,7-bisphosphatase